MPRFESICTFVRHCGESYTPAPIDNSMLYTAVSADTDSGRRPAEVLQISSTALSTAKELSLSPDRIIQSLEIKRFKIVKTADIGMDARKKLAWSSAEQGEDTACRHPTSKKKPKKGRLSITQLPNR